MVALQRALALPGGEESRGRGSHALLPAAGSLVPALLELRMQPLSTSNVTDGWLGRKADRSMLCCFGRYEFTNELLSRETLLV